MKSEQAERALARMRQHLNDLGKPGARDHRRELPHQFGAMRQAMQAMRRAALLGHIQAGINSGDSGGDTLVDSGVIRERRVQPGCGSGHVFAVGIGGTRDLAGGLGRAPPGLIGAGWIAGDAKATVTP